MPARFPVPDESRLQQLIAEAYERTPVPDIARIEHGGERLTRRRAGSPESSVNKIPWWIVLLLAGGMAAAAWWAGEKLLSPPPGVNENGGGEIRPSDQWDQPQPPGEGTSQPDQAGDGTEYPMSVNREEGFSLVSAIFLIVLVAALGAFMVTIGTTQQRTSMFSVMGTRALTAADSGLQWAIRRAIRDGGAGLNCTVPPSAPGQVNFNLGGGAMAGFNVRISCRVQSFTEGPDTYNVFALESLASRGAAGGADYFRRSIRATVTTAP